MEELHEKRDLLIGKITWWAHLKVAVIVPGGAASGVANPYHHRSICGEEKGWPTAIDWALADRAHTLGAALCRCYLRNQEGAHFLGSYENVLNL